MRKIPVNIISGFLGSGKTTTIIKLLKDKVSEDRWAVIINEFGKVSIDSQTLGVSSDAPNIYEVSGGCICCSAKGYFQENLEQIIQTGNYSRIIIEPSGLGGIEMVSDIIQKIGQLRLMRVICLVDILGLQIEKLQRIPIYRTQIFNADVIIFTKCDLLESLLIKNQLAEKFKSLFPGKASYFNNNDTNFWADLLVLESHESKEKNKFRMMMFSADPQLMDANYQSDNYLFNAETIISIEKLNEFFQNHPAIIRAKGFLHTDKGWMLLNFALSSLNFDPCIEKAQNEMVIIIDSSQFNAGDYLKEEIVSTMIGHSEQYQLELR